MLFRARKVDVFHNEEALEELQFLDRLCFATMDGGLKLDAPDANWWLVYHNDDPVAYAGLNRSYQSKQLGYLCRAGVHPKYRGNRLQQRLLKTRVKFARGRGWIGLLTDTSYDNIASANNLIEAGFKLFTPREPWAFKDSLYWKREL